MSLDKRKLEVLLDNFRLLVGKDKTKHQLKCYGHYDVVKNKSMTHYYINSLNKKVECYIVSENSFQFFVRNQNGCEVLLSKKHVFKI